MRNSAYILLGLLLCCCTDDPKPNVSLNIKELKENLIKANKVALNKETKQIEAYIQEQGLSVIQTQTGLRYALLKDVEGPNAIESQKVLVTYKVNLLNGTTCYETLEKPEEFTVGKDDVESGLHEAIQFMSEGDKAVVIIPSHLAHGLAGDLKRIPIKSTIVYHIELLKIK